MSRIFIATTVSALASVLAGGTAIAQATTEVTVEATRVVQTRIGRSASGVPISDISVSYGVTTSGLDLGSPAGAAQFEARIKAAAAEACASISRQYPDATPKDEECTKEATERAMPKVRELEAAAARKTAR